MIDKINSRFIVFKKDNIDLINKYIEENIDLIESKVFSVSCCSSNDYFSTLVNYNHKSIDDFLDFISSKPKKSKSKIIFLVADYNLEKKINTIYDRKYFELILQMLDSARFITKIVVIEFQKRSNIIESGIDLEKFYFYKNEPLF